MRTNSLKGKNTKITYSTSRRLRIEKPHVQTGKRKKMRKIYLVTPYPSVTTPFFSNQRCRMYVYIQFWSDNETLFNPQEATDGAINKSPP